MSLWTHTHTHLHSWQPRGNEQKFAIPVTPGWWRLLKSPFWSGVVFAAEHQSGTIRDVGTTGMGDSFSRQVGPSSCIKILVILKRACVFPVEHAILTCVHPPPQGTHTPSTHSRTLSKAPSKVAITDVNFRPYFSQIKRKAFLIS